MKKTIEISYGETTETHEVALTPLARDLATDGLMFLDIDEFGALHVLTGDTIEVWQARPEGSGANNTYWGDLIGGYEFCRSYAADGIKCRGEFMKGVD